MQGLQSFNHRYERSLGYVLVDYACKSCNVVFTIRKDKFNKKKTPFCEPCYQKSSFKNDAMRLSASNRRNYCGKQNPNYRGGGLITSVCKCGTEFTKKFIPYELSNGIHVYCSKECKKKFAVSKKRPYEYSGVVMWSSWEVAFAKFLDERGSPWRYEPKIFQTPFGYYTPDFYSEGIFYEVKGFWRDEESKNKFYWLSRQIPMVLVDRAFIEKIGYKLTNKGLEKLE